MPIIQVENGYIYKKNTKNTKMKKAVFILLLFVIAVLILASSMFAFSKFDFTSAFNMNKYLIYNSKSYYAISLKQGVSFAEVSDETNLIKIQDGAGFVYKQNGTYHLIASTYGSKSDAEKVINNISNYDAQIVEIKFDKLILSAKYTSEQIEMLRYSLGMVDRFFNVVESIIISFDRGEILDAEVRQKLQVFKESCQEDKENLAKVFKDNSDVVVTYVKIFQSEVISNLSSAIVSQNLSGDLKYITISTLSSFEMLQKNIKK